MGFPYRRADDTKTLAWILKVNAGYAAYARRYFWKFNPRLQYGLKVVWTYNMFKTGGPWDLKLAAPPTWRLKDVLKFRGGKISPENFGKIHYGYEGHYLDYSRRTLVRASMFAHFTSGWRGGWPPERADHRKISWGYRLSSVYGHTRRGYYYVQSTANGAW